MTHDPELVASLTATLMAPFGGLMATGGDPMYGFRPLQEQEIRDSANNAVRILDIVAEMSSTARKPRKVAV